MKLHYVQFYAPFGNEPIEPNWYSKSMSKFVSTFNLYLKFNPISISNSNFMSKCVSTFNLYLKFNPISISNSNSMSK